MRTIELSLQVKFIATLFLLACGLLHAQSADISIGKIDTIHSEILNEDRTVWVHVPKDYLGREDRQKYPVVYLLDGEGHFYSVVGMIRQLSSINGNALMPKMIVVGITNTNRTRDLTPTEGKPVPPYIDERIIAGSGGGDKFMSFVAEELIPYIENNYPTENYRTFIGHSFGGLTVMNTLVHQPELFNAYIAIDPSMWWDHHHLMNEIKNHDFDERYKNRSLYLGIANHMTKGLDTVAVKKDTTFVTDNIRTLLELNKLMKSDFSKPLDYKGAFHEDDDHGSVPLISEYEGLRFIFDFYKFNFGIEHALDPNYDVKQAIIAYYEEISAHYGKEIIPDERFVNLWGYNLLNVKEYEKAEQLFKLNVKNHPDSYNVYDSIGDFYAAIGDNEKALENYEKSVALDKDAYSKEKIKMLKAASND